MCHSDHLYQRMSAIKVPGGGTGAPKPFLAKCDTKESIFVGVQHKIGRHEPNLTQFL